MKAFKMALMGGVMAAAPLCAGTAESWQGVIESRQGYQLIEASGKTNAQGDTLGHVQVGDRIVAQGDQVSVRFADSGMLIVGAKSSAQLAANHVVKLESGYAAVGFRNDSPISVSYDQLAIVPLATSPAQQNAIVPTAGESRSGVIRIQQVDPARVRIGTLNQMAIVKNLETGAQIGVVGANDMLEYAKDAVTGMWAPATAPARMQDTVTGTTDDHRDDSTAALNQGAGGGGLGGVGGGVAGGLAGLGIGGAAALYAHNSSQDDQQKLENKIDDLEDEQQSPNSP